MPAINGFLIIDRETPSFVLPVFVDRPGSNQSLIQQIDQNDRIASFLEIDVGNSYEIADERPSAEIGDPALWGFRSLSGEIVLGITSELSKILKPRLKRGDYRDFPLIENQIAKFCKDRRAYSSALARSFKTLRDHSPLTAQIWRDSVILLPEAKRELARSIGGPRQEREDQDFSDIRLTTKGSRIEVEITSNLVDAIDLKQARSIFSETQHLGKAFGLSSLSLVIRKVTYTSSDPPPEFTEVYGTAASFTGIGDVALGKGISAKRGKALLPPWIDSRAPLQSKTPPLISISVLNTEPRVIENARRHAGSHSGSVRIAIVTLPISFGTSRGHKFDIYNPSSQLREFDYVFVVGNHVLQKPVAFAPRLAASSRAVKYVKACIDGLMQIVWATTGPKTPEQFYNIFPRQGFGLIGRCEVSGDSGGRQALSYAMISALNERLPINKGRRLAFIGPTSIIDAPESLEYMETITAYRSSDVISIVSTNARRAVTVLAFGIEPSKKSSVHFREFCRELLQSKNFRLIREAETITIGELDSFGPLAIGFAASDSSIDPIISSLQRHKTRHSLILSSFSPTDALFEYIAKRGVLILHYSHLDEALSESLSAPKIATKRDLERRRRRRSERH